MRLENIPFRAAEIEQRKEIDRGKIPKPLVVIDAYLSKPAAMARSPPSSTFTAAADCRRAGAMTIASADDRLGLCHAGRGQLCKPWD